MRRVGRWISVAAIGGLLLGGAFVEAAGNTLAAAQSARGTTVLTLAAVPAGCVETFEPTVIGGDGHFELFTHVIRTGCGVPPGNTRDVNVDVGMLLPGHYTVHWVSESASGLVDVAGSFDVVASPPGYLTPPCPAGRCIVAVPAATAADTKTRLILSVYGGLPQCARVSDPHVTSSCIDGTVAIEARYVVQDGCSEPDAAAVRSLEIPIPLLAPGRYMVTLKLVADASVKEPPPVSGVLGSAPGGIFREDPVSVAGPLELPLAYLVEYYHAPFDHYFMTLDPAEIALLDARQPPFQDWTRTGFALAAHVDWPPLATRFCRFFNATFAPKSSHFYGADGNSASDCRTTLNAFPDWTLETEAAFFAYDPYHCGSAEKVVYRVYNNGMGGAPNHRFAADEGQLARMLAAGWAVEGRGRFGDSRFCAQSLGSVVPKY